MTVRELNIGDVFRVAGDETLWRKASQSRARPADRPYSQAVELSDFTGQEIEVVLRADAGDVRRSGDTLILRGGEVTLEYNAPWRVLRCTPGEKFTEFILAGSSFSSSRAGGPTEDTALGFMVGAGARHLNRPRGSELLAYKGRVYARATYKEVLGRPGQGGYQRRRMIDGKPRLLIACLLCVPNEFALYDIIMEHFGPDAVPPEPGA